MIKKDIEGQDINHQKRLKTIKRLVFDTIFFLLILITGIILLQKSLIFETEKITKYTEKSNLDYKVYLLDNDFYEQDYLGKDMLYVASLIDKISVDFDYTFESEEDDNIDFNYKILATLSINNSSNSKLYFEKTYVLLDNKIVNMKDKNTQNIKESINIDYQYYNALANGFKNQYGIDVDSKLTVYMVINKKNANDTNFVMDDFGIMNIVIPLSERSVDIRLDYKDINETKNIIKREKVTFKDYIPVISAVILIILSLVLVIRIIRKIDYLIPKKSKYDKYVSKILKEYDRLIAESSTLLSFDEKEIISITKFSELLDIHDNLQLPIMYYEVSKHKECYFYISHENMVYLLKVDRNYINNMK